MGREGKGGRDKRKKSRKVIERCTCICKVCRVIGGVGDRARLGLVKLGVLDFFELDHYGRSGGGMRWRAMVARGRERESV